MIDRYDGKNYIINGKMYSEKQALKYLITIKFTEEEANQYLFEIRIKD